LISQNIKPKLIENGAPRPGPPFEGIVESFKPVSIEGPDRTTDKDPGIWLQFPVFCPMMKPEDMSTIGNDEPARAEGVRVPESPVMESTALQARKTAAVVENRISILLLSHGNGEYAESALAQYQTELRETVYYPHKQWLQKKPMHSRMVQS